MLLLFYLLLVCLFLIVFGFSPLNENLVSLPKQKKKKSIENIFSLISFSSGSTQFKKVKKKKRKEIYIYIYILGYTKSLLKLT